MFKYIYTMPELNSQQQFDNIITTLGTNAQMFTGDENQDYYIRRNLEELLFNSYNIEG